MLFIHLDYVENICPLSNVMGRGGIQLAVLKAPYKHKKKKKKHSTAEIMTRLFKIIHRSCCEQFHVGTIFFLPNYSA